MKKSLFQFITIIPLALLLCLTFGCQTLTEEAETEAGALSDEDVAAIRTAYDAILQATLAGNMEATLEFYTEDAVLIMGGGIVIEGREAYKEILKALSVSLTFTALNITIAEIDGRYDLAFVRGTSSTTMGREGVPEPIQRTGKFIEILRKQDDGSWLIARSIVATD